MKAEAMKNPTKRALAGAATTLAMAGLTLAATPPAFAATAAVTDTCDAAVTTLRVGLAGYSTVPGQPEHTEHILVSPEVPGTPDTTVRGEIISPAVEAVPAVTVTEWEFVKQLPNATGGQGKDNDLKNDPADLEYKWFDGKGPNDASVWTKTGESRERVVTGAVPAQDEVRAPDVVVPGTPALPAVWKDVVTPAVPADPTPNGLVLLVDGDVRLDTSFGTSFSDTLSLDGTVTHSYELVVAASGEEEATLAEGVTQACAPAGPEGPADETTPADQAATPAVTSVTPLAAAADTASVHTLASTGTSAWTIPALLGAIMMALAGIATMITGRRAKRH